jgi:hypothetical protein
MGKSPQDLMIENWRRQVAENTRAIEMYESGKMRSHLGPGSNAQTDTTAEDVKRLREINALLQGLIERNATKR